MEGYGEVMSMNFSMPEMLAHSASCMALLRNVGIRQTKPIAMICEDYLQQDVLVKRLRVFSDNRKRRLSSYEEKYMLETKDDILFFQYISSEQDSCLMQICENLAEGYLDDEPINCMVCVMFNGYIPVELIDWFSIIVPNQEIDIFLKKDWSGITMQKVFTGAKRDWMDFFNYLKARKYQDYILFPINGDEELLYVSSAIKVYFLETQKILEPLCKIVAEKVTVSLDARDRSDIPALFVDVLYQNPELISPMVSYYDAAEMDSNEQYVLFDETTYYIPELFMGRVLRKMTCYAGTTEIKQALMKAEYLEVQGSSRNYYTQKVSVGGKRSYFYRLRREHVDRIGQATLSNMCE